MGRKEDHIWLFFKKNEANGRTRAQCQDCFEDIVPLVERMRNHHEKCEARQQGPDDSPGPSAPKARKTQGTLGFKSSHTINMHTNCKL